MLTPTKKNTFAGLSAAVVLATGQLAGAAEPGELEARIAALEAQLEALKTAVAAAKAEDGVALVGPPEADTASSDGAARASERLETLSIGQASLEETMALSHVTKRDDTWFRYGGYVQLDALMTNYSEGKPASPVIDDFLVPPLIPVAPVSGESDSYQSTNLHAKTSRFWFGTETETRAGRIRSHIELDFLLGNQGNERISNSFAARIRHAFVDWEYAPGKSLMAGQNWSTFFDVTALPDLLDFVGPIGTEFGRQPQLRWTSGGLQLALENPSTRFDVEGGGTRLDDSEIAPDFIARYNGQTGELRWTVAGIARQLSYEARDGAVETDSDSTIGYGARLTGKWQLGADDLRFTASYGNALGRYLGLHSFNDGYIASDGDIQTIDSMGLGVSYLHSWSPAWRSTFALSLSEADNPSMEEFLGAGNLARAYRSAHANLWYTPAPGLQLGGELIYGYKELEDGRDGELHRLQLAVKYVF
ncbi:DcaP family trimeric outer membrane transporter [Pseudohaliea rubra]|uniref:Porin n=1 Tax=Pseudohaliea rubra DSM 19751 TaxID=1265313 RepID=A0A095X214_9GAMM|nr:DcaP family trimeric outer membrane transporter [Pseudohaliea rubra]KGE04924.1 hypothetical protein HRUBRA_00397 [Pseudohaliea rubra DSM 19751]